MQVPFTMPGFNDIMQEIRSKFDRRNYDIIDLDTDHSDLDYNDSVDEILGVPSTSNSASTSTDIQCTKPLMAKYIKSKYRCKCGANLVLVNDPDHDIYNGDTARCDQCGRDIPRSETFYHCTRFGDDTPHRHGFDLCTECVHPKSNELTIKSIPELDGRHKFGNKSLLLTSSDHKCHDQNPKSKRIDLKMYKNVGSSRKRKQLNHGFENYSDSEAVSRLKKEKALLISDKIKQNKTIKILRQNLESVSKTKNVRETTLKSVKKQIRELVVKKEVKECSLENNGCGEGREVMDEIERKFKQFRREQLRRNNKMKKNEERMESMEEIMSNLYQVFGERMDEQQSAINKMQKRLDELEKESVHCRERKENKDSTEEEEKVETEKSNDSLVRDPLSDDIDREIQGLEMEIQSAEQQDVFLRDNLSDDLS